MRYAIIILFTFSVLQGALYAQNVGINNTNPERDLDVFGEARIDKMGSSGDFPTLELRESGNPKNYSRLKFSKTNFDDYWIIAARPKDTLNSGRFNIFNPDLGNAFSIYENGRVGINSTIPAAMLHINSSNGSDPLRIQNNGSTKLRIFDNSSISIGTNNENVSAGDVYIHNKLGIGVNPPIEPTVLFPILT